MILWSNQHNSRFLALNSSRHGVVFVRMVSIETPAKWFKIIKTVLTVLLDFLLIHHVIVWRAVT